jgi:hypothetical protein
MSEFKSALKPYDLDTALATDRGEDCLIINVGRDEGGQSVASLKQVSDAVERYVNDEPELVSSATKLYVVGEWNLTPYAATTDAESKDDAAIGDADATARWQEATIKIRSLLEQMSNLRELT